VPWFDAATPFWFAALLSLANVIVVRFVFTETLTEPQSDKRIDWRKSARNINHAWALAPLRSLFVTNFLFQFGFSSFTTFSSVFLIARFGFTQGGLGDFFAYIGLWIAFSQAVITRQVSRRVPEVRVLRVTLFAGGLSMLLYLVPQVWWGLLFVVPVFAAFNGLNQANLVGLLSRSASPRIQGEVLGINASVQALAQTLPPLLAGVVAGRVGPGAPLVVAAASIVGAGVFFRIAFTPTTAPVE
jgi:DHA1 family tetracycline resistance protein-like MFS transporter